MGSLCTALILGIIFAFVLLAVVTKLDILRSKIKDDAKLEHAELLRGCAWWYSEDMSAMFAIQSVIEVLRGQNISTCRQNWRNKRDSYFHNENKTET
jgi:hypothetical protein